MQDYFYALADAVSERMTGDEGFTADFSAERSHFVRFNRSAVRQPGVVSQAYLSLELFRGRRHANVAVSVTENADEDIARLDKALTVLRGYFGKRTGRSPFPHQHRSAVQRAPGP